jgi:hypothetical protein
MVTAGVVRACLAITLNPPGRTVRVGASPGRFGVATPIACSD